MDSKVKLMTHRTGAPTDKARELLSASNGNLENAVAAYNLMQHSSRPPSGPQKNQEPKTVNQARSERAASLAAMAGGRDSRAPVADTHSSSPTNSLNRRLKRGMSKTTENIGLVNKARNVMLQDITEGGSVQVDENNQHYVDTPEYTFILPDLTQFADDLRAFLHKDLIETSTLVSLEQAGRLNWWADMGVCQRLLPLATTGDGNCLLHAASLGMWGFHDRLLMLRKNLYSAMSSVKANTAFWRRWRFQQTLQNKQSGLILSDEEWTMEWTNMLKLASSKPKTTPGSTASCCHSPATNGVMELNSEERSSEDESEVFYESLEEFHVFVLAHVLRRPILVVADTILRDCDGDALAPIPFGGLYLPLERKPTECHRSPLLLTYDAAHFSALVAMDRSPQDDKPPLPAAVPLVDPEFKLLPIHFMVDPGTHFIWGKDENDTRKMKNLELAMDSKLTLVRQYLDVECISIPVSTPEPQINNTDTPPEKLNGPLNGPLSKSVVTRTCSVDSDESSNSSGSSKDKDKINGEKDKKKVAKQMQTVAKSFGSIGKTMSKKLKNLGSHKTGKDADKKKNNRGMGTVTQTTKRGSLTVEMLSDRDHVLCGLLLFKRLGYQEDLVQNYLQEARNRFEADRDLRRQQDEEMKRIAEKRRLEHQPVQCVNPECFGRGTASTSYLCQACYNRQKEQELSQKSSSHGAQSVNAQAPLVNFRRQDTLINEGKSKFYTLKEEQHNSDVDVIDGCEPVMVPRQSHPQHSSPEHLNNARLNRTDKKPALELARSTFYDESVSNVHSGDKSSNPPATSGPCMVNNLRNVNENSGRDYKIVHKEMMNLPPAIRANYIDDFEEPPLRPEFSNMQSRNAFRIKNENIQRAQVNTQQDMDKRPLVDPSFVAKVLPQTDPRNHYQQQCRTEGCTFYGTEVTHFFCSGCYKRLERTAEFRAHKQAKT